jgi:hypothetical protein
VLNSGVQADLLFNDLCYGTSSNTMKKKKKKKKKKNRNYRRFTLHPESYDVSYCFNPHLAVPSGLVFPSLPFCHSRQRNIFQCSIASQHAVCLTLTKTRLDPVERRARRFLSILRICDPRWRWHSNCMNLLQTPDLALLSTLRGPTRRPQDDTKQQKYQDASLG